MVDSKAKSVGTYLLRLISGVAAILGALAIFSALARGDLFGVVLGVIFIVGGVIGLKYATRDRSARERSAA